MHDYLALDYCYDIEMTRTLERHEAGEAVIIPVILRDVDWSDAPFGKLQALPKSRQAGQAVVRPGCRLAERRRGESKPAAARLREERSPRKLPGLRSSAATVDLEGGWAIRTCSARVK